MCIYIYINSLFLDVEYVCECFGEATLHDILYLATVVPVCMISSDRAYPGKCLKSRIVKYLVDSSLLMGSRFAPVLQNQ